MAKPVLSFLDYLSEAFHASPIVPGLGPFPVNKLALGGAFILGFANPGFWAVGAALEMLYLYSLSTNSRFQKYVQSKYMTVVQKDKSEKINAMIMSLDKESTDRLNQLNQNLAEVNRLMEMDSSGSVDFVKENKQRTLSQLPVMFLKLLVTKNLANQSLLRTDGEALKKQVIDLSEQAKDKTISEALSRSIHGTLEILEKRLENLKRAREQLQIIEMELNRIENQVQLVREEIAINRSPESITSSLDRISSTLSETEQWMDNHREFFSRMGTTAETPAVTPAATESEPQQPVAPPSQSEKQ
jgi:hypothetical protein